MTALTQREQAVALLSDLLVVHPQGVECQRAVRLAEASGISKRTMERAARQLGLVTKHNGRLPGFWVPR